MTCVTCHVPGHPPGTVAGSPDESIVAPHLLRGPATAARNDICFQCHTKNQWAGLSPHRDAAQKKTGCILCHSRQPVWGVDRADTVRFVADVNIVCLACHDNPDHPGAVRHTVTLKAGMPEVPGSLPLGTGSRITCATCHNPHLDSADGHRLRGAKEPTAFCARCHKL
jgi:predicted CXXCH cytochrome family protein